MIRSKTSEIACINRHDERMRLAAEKYPRQAICPDHYIPCKLNKEFEHED